MPTKTEPREVVSIGWRLLDPKELIGGQAAFSPPGEACFLKFSDAGWKSSLSPFFPVIDLDGDDACATAQVLGVDFVETPELGCTVEL